MTECTVCEIFLARDEDQINDRVEKFMIPYPLPAYCQGCSDTRKTRLLGVHELLPLELCISKYSFCMAATKILHTCWRRLLIHALWKEEFYWFKHNHKDHLFWNSISICRNLNVMYFLGVSTIKTYLYSNIPHGLLIVISALCLYPIE